MKVAHKLMLAAGGVVLGYVGLVLVLPRVLEDRDYFLLSSRLADIERTLAVLADRAENGRELRAASGEGPELEALTPRVTRAALRGEGQALDASDVLERLERVVVALEKLERGVREQNALLDRTGSAPSLRHVLDAKQEMDEEALSQVAAQWRQDGERTKRSMQLLTRAEVLARFGPPTELEGETWSYEFDWNGQAFTSQLVVRFHDEYVSGVWMTLDR